MSNKIFITKRRIIHIFFGIALLGLALLCIVWIYINSQADSTITVSALVSNDAPEITEINIAITNGGVHQPAINLIENSNKQIFVHGTYKDINGCDEVDPGGSITVDFFRSGIGSAACDEESEKDHNHCYRETCSLSNCSGGSDTTGSYECAIALAYFSDPTDTGTFADQHWVAKVNVTDSMPITASDTQNTEINSLLGVDTNGVNLNYGTINLGNNSSEQSIEINAVGNRAIDTNVYGTNLSCDNGSINVNQQRYSDSSGFNFNDGTSLSDSSTKINLNIPHRTNDATPSTDNVYWQLQMPASGIEGTCSGTVSLEATLDDGS